MSGTDKIHVRLIVKDHAMDRTSLVLEIGRYIGTAKMDCMSISISRHKIASVSNKLRQRTLEFELDRLAEAVLAWED